jgi:hypothetical protein
VIKPSLKFVKKIIEKLKMNGEIELRGWAGVNIAAGAS